MGKNNAKSFVKKKILCQQCHVEEQHKEWWEMLNHVLIAGQNMKSKTCDFLR